MIQKYNFIAVEVAICKIGCLLLSDWESQQNKWANWIMAFCKVTQLDLQTANKLGL